MNSFYRVIGLMSGTSLDGLDIVAVEFALVEKKWDYTIRKCETRVYPPELKSKLASALKLSGLELKKLDLQLGNFFGESIVGFLSGFNFQSEFVSSHGHTVFHQPEKKLTLQIGSAAAIHATTRLPVVFDFRSLDVQLGGQGAPLVPIADELLFHDFSACLNLGGIANVSFRRNQSRFAFDICPFNMVFNHFAKKLGKEFDAEGRFAGEGSVNKTLLTFLNSLEYYSLAGPKSLGYEMVEKEIIIPVEKMNLDPRDVLRTALEHFSNLIAKPILDIENARSVLVTGGGTYNTFFIENLKNKLPGINVVIPEKEIIEFKEAVAFGLMGVLRIRGEENVLKSVTGASENSSCGSIIGKIQVK